MIRLLLLSIAIVAGFLAQDEAAADAAPDLMHWSERQTEAVANHLADRPNTASAAVWARRAVP
ncbi:hypothetical protein [Phaeobacter sp.]|uniref:hypothetical protein n=1 Tax=Phaeobacter sp. TaxID=1902409 RepID=UPI0025F4FCCB|nr:hypothetical protein [Phaeobacter sp.]